MLDTEGIEVFAFAPAHGHWQISLGLLAGWAEPPRFWEKTMGLTVAQHVEKFGDQSTNHFMGRVIGATRSGHNMYMVFDQH